MIEAVRFYLAIYFLSVVNFHIRLSCNSRPTLAVFLHLASFKSNSGAVATVRLTANRLYSTVFLSLNQYIV
jgi:hypothetical protein